MHIPSNAPQNTYASAGVSIDEGNALVEAIKPLAKSTMRTGVASSIGGFGALFDLKATGYQDPLLVATTDGVGTKLKIAQACQNFSGIGIDLVAMCVNDLIVQGAEPLFFLDYYATGKLSVAEGKAIIAGIAEGCRLSGCALIGGETAEMPGLYKDGDFDLAGFAVGAVERNAVLPRHNIAAGDVIVGLASTGLHSNGFSLVRRILEQQRLSLEAIAPFDESKTLGSILLTPTALYVKPLLAAHRLGILKGLAHITGGGLLENIPRILPDTIGVELYRNSWPTPPVFRWLQTAGDISEPEMQRVFNCGIGMVAIVAPSDADKLMAFLSREAIGSWIIGRTITGSKHVHIK